MNKQEAADFLGVSPRQIERYTKENRIGVRFEKGRTKPTPVYDEGELRRFKQELERPVHRPAVRRIESEPMAIATQSDGGMSQLSALDIVSQMFETMRSNQQQSVPTLAPSIQDLGTKLLLSVEEAARYSGTSRSAINHAIREGNLTAHRGKWRGRRIKRADLEKYFGKL